MKGDFTRNTFDPLKHYSRVLMQQGRVQLDADQHEQTAILLRYMWTLATDLIGPHGGPAGESLGFEIAPNGPNDFLIGAGRYYVMGVLSENDRLLSYRSQPDYPLPEAKKIEHCPQGKYLVYLDVWERHITYIQDDHIREVALGGPDTATRAKVVWQVKIEAWDGDACPDDSVWNDLVDQWQPKNRGKLKARAKLPDDADLSDPCIIPPEARYRGLENQLYRVEIHRGGAAWDGQDKNSNRDIAATVMISRDNGSVEFPILDITTDTNTDTTIVTLEHLGRDSRFSLQKGNWVQLADDACSLQNCAEPLLKVNSVNYDSRQVTLAGTPASLVGQDPAGHPLLRRWDHMQTQDAQLADGALLLQENQWVHLEDGIQIYFESGGNYRTGDYWLIPARVATGDVEWPKDPAGDPIDMPPNGIEHYYAPLAVMTLGDYGAIMEPIVDCRCSFPRLCASAAALEVVGVSYYDHDYLELQPTDVTNGIPRFTFANNAATNLSAFLVKFNRPIRRDTVVSSAKKNVISDGFSFLVHKDGADYVPGFTRFESPVTSISYVKDAGILFDRWLEGDPGHEPFQRGEYTVTLFGAGNGNRPAITTANGDPLVGNEGQNFQFKFTVK